MDKETEKKGGRTHGQICILGGPAGVGWLKGRQTGRRTDRRQTER